MNSDEVMIVNEEEDEITIDFWGIFHAIAKKWYIVLFVAVAFGFALGAYGRFVVKDAYEAEASMCIIDSNKEVSMSDLQVGSALTNDYEGIIKSRVVLTKVIANLKLDIEYKGLYNAVSIENPDGTRIIKINVVSQDQKEAVDIANEILQISIEEIPNVLGSSVPTVLDKADILFTENTRHSILFYSVIGVALGMFFACGIIALTVITNVSVKTDEDVQKCDSRLQRKKTEENYVA